MVIHISITGLSIEKQAVEQAAQYLRSNFSWSDLIGQKAVDLSPLKEPVNGVVVTASVTPVESTPR